VKLVVVRWLDHVSCHYDPGNWVDISNYDKVELGQMESVGWVVRETDDLIVIASTVSESTVGNDLVIAKRLIDDIQEIKVPKRRKKA